MYEENMKSSSLGYNRHETRDKRLLGRDPDSILVCCCRCSCSHGLQPKKLYQTQSVAVTQLLSESLPNGCLSQVSRRLCQELFILPSYDDIWNGTTPTK